MRAKKLNGAIVAGIVCITGARAQAQCALRFVDDDPIAGDYAGNCVAQSAGHYAVAAPRADTGGRVLVYELLDGASVETAELPSPAGNVHDAFGRVIAMAGDYLAVGAPLEDAEGLQDSGVVYVFRRYEVMGQSMWFLDSTILNPWAAAGMGGDAFGSGLAMRTIDGVPVLAIGAPWKDEVGIEDVGVVFIYTHDDDKGWSLEDYLLPTVEVEGQRFGQAIDMDDDRIIVSASRETVGGMSSAGAVYVFNRTAMDWGNGQRILAPLLDRDELDYFGSDVAVSGDRIVVGASGDDGPDRGGGSTGTVYVFGHNGFGWSLEARLRVSDPEIVDFLGDSVDIEGDIVVSSTAIRNRVLAWRSDGAGGWVLFDELAPTEPPAGNATFGDDLALAPNGAHVLVGAARDDISGAVDAGSAYLMVIRCCRVDWDRNGVVNSTDVSRFINEWFGDQVEGTLLTDFNGDGVVNSTDVSDFINAWFEGCER